jgi:hypothetical protein
MAFAYRRCFAVLVWPSQANAQSPATQRKFKASPRLSLRYVLRPFDETHVRAELQPLDTDPQRSTVAMQKVFEKRFQTTRAADALVDFFDLSTCQFSPSRANRSRFPQAIEKNLDFAQCKTHIPREADKEYPVKGLIGIAPLAAGAVRTRD